MKYHSILTTALITLVFPATAAHSSSSNDDHSSSVASGTPEKKTYLRRSKKWFPYFDPNDDLTNNRPLEPEDYNDRIIPYPSPDDDDDDGPCTYPNDDLTNNRPLGPEDCIDRRIPYWKKPIPDYDGPYRYGPYPYPRPPRMNAGGLVGTNIGTEKTEKKGDSSSVMNSDVAMKISADVTASSESSVNLPPPSEDVSHMHSMRPFLPVKPSWDPYSRYEPYGYEPYGYGYGPYYYPNDDGIDLVDKGTEEEWEEDNNSMNSALTTN